jgi:hypothetical protein
MEEVEKVVRRTLLVGAVTMTVTGIGIGEVETVEIEGGRVVIRMMTVIEVVIEEVEEVGGHVAGVAVVKGAETVETDSVEDEAKTIGTVIRMVLVGRTAPMGTETTMTCPTLPGTS